MGKLDAIKKMKNEYQKKIEDEGKALLRAAFTEFFAENPKVQAIRWRQYTPYFNDGETCEFSIHDFYERCDGTEEDVGDYDDGFDYAEGKTEAFLRSIEDEDVFLAVFGDHVMVTATRDGFEVEEWEHD